MEFGKPGSWNHWWIEVKKNGYEEITAAGSVTETTAKEQAIREPAREGNGETDRTISQ
jgi:hypothetical protein